MARHRDPRPTLDLRALPADRLRALRSEAATAGDDELVEEVEAVLAERR